MPQKSVAKRKAWEEKIKSWRESGLSAKNWCLKNNENCHQFRYWRQALKVSKPIPIFEELKEDSPKPLEIELHQGDIMIVFPKGCSPSLLDLCLKSLRRNQCSQ